MFANVQTKVDRGAMSTEDIHKKGLTQEGLTPDGTSSG